jgi:chromosome segregation ATPase
MIVPTIVKERWVVPPTSIETLETNLSETKADLQTTLTELAEAKTDLQATRANIETINANVETINNSKLRDENALEATNAKLDHLTSQTTLLQNVVFQLTKRIQQLEQA